MADNTNLTLRSGSAMKLRCVILAGALSLLAPAAFAQQAAGDGFKGQGAALCIAAGELLAAQPGADAGIQEGVLGWRQVLHIVEGTEDRREAALDSARASLASSDNAGPGRAANTARAFWSAGCATREMQLGYIDVHGSEVRVRTNLADEPGAELGTEAANRLNMSASCLVAAELFSQRRPSRAFQAALRSANPRHPDAGALRAIQAQARQEIDAAPGSAVGKGLLVDYLRYLFGSASTGLNPQPFVNLMSQRLRDRC
jgi:hypothetical protein